MSIAADEDDGVDATTPPRIIRFADLPRQPLDQGRGSAREIWAELDHDLTLRWQLRVVEIKDSTGLLVGPAGTHHHVVGLAGPQVAVRNTESNRVLRRAMSCRCSPPRCPSNGPNCGRQGRAPSSS